jgi:hypothetical protein
MDKDKLLLMKKNIPVIILWMLLFPAGLLAQWEGTTGQMPAYADTIGLHEPSYEDTLEVYEGLFTETEPLHLTLKFNIKSFQRTRRQEKYQPAEMTNHVNDTFQVRHPVRVKARGIYRRDHCTTPPFWLNIRYSGVEAQELDDIRRMKMVIRCRGSSQYENYVLREYLVYRIYNLISPYSYRVRLVRLKFVDTGRNNREWEDWAFLIEPDEMMARRLNARVIKSDQLSTRTVNSGVMDLLSMFQYMIGNGDFSVTGRHNLRILTVASPGPHGFVPVPYDFDFTGLVNTHYAVPNESLGTQSVRERYFLGPCRTRSVYLKTLDTLESIRDEIMEMIMTFEYLPEDERADMLAYLESFFTSAEQERFVERELSTTCR